MKKHYPLVSKNWARVGLVTAISIFPYFGLQAQTAPAKLWDKTIGASGLDQLSILKQTSDGGYILGGGSDSGISGDKSQASKGALDFWVVKTDANGTKTWDKTIGGSSDESFRTMIQTTDGGYILGGYSNSGISGDKSQASKGLFDYWVVKIDATGNKVWDKTLGGSADESLFSVHQTTDGGFILAGNSKSGISGDKTQASKGLADFWVVKLDATGTKVWDKTLGGRCDEALHSVQQTADGGYILGGTSVSSISGDKTEASKGLTDFWVVKLDASGTKVWDKTLGGSADDSGLINILQVTDGGYVVSGSSASGISGDKTEASKGSTDYWVVKLDATGTKVWDKTLGGSAADGPRALQQTADGGYIIGGTSASGLSGDKSEANKGTTNVNDYWVVKLNTTGNKVWDKTLGTSGTESFNSLRQTSDGGFLVGGYSDSGINGDKTQATKGGSDYWVVKLAAANPVVANDVSVSALTSINSGCGLTNQETITITVVNYGTAPQSNIPVSYKIGATGTPVPGTIAGPIAPGASTTYSFPTKADLSVLGTYTIEARTNLTGDALATNDLISKTVTLAAAPAAPTVAAGGSSSLCTGGTVTLTATSATTGVTYQWFKDGVAIANATSASYIANAAGSYTVTAPASGCAGPASAATVLTMNTPPIAPAVTASGPLAICVNNGSVTFTAASVTGATFTWFKNGNIIPGATSATYTATTVGSYTASATLNGCNSPTSAAKVVTTQTTPAAPSISKAGFVLTSSSTANNQWYKDAVLIPGATNRTYTATSNGCYTVVVTSNGCSSVASNAVCITNLSVNDDLNAIKVTISPNPSTGIFQVELPKGQAYEMEVTDLTGKVILSQKNAGAKTVVDLNGKAKGVYLLKLISEGKTATRKLVIE